MSWNIFLTATAKRELKRLPSNVSRRLINIFTLMKGDPWTGDILKLGGKDNEWRRRIGEYRFKYKVFSKDQTVQIYEIERRTSKTYQ